MRRNFFLFLEFSSSKKQKKIFESNDPPRLYVAQRNWIRNKRNLLSDENFFTFLEFSSSKKQKKIFEKGGDGSDDIVFYVYRFLKSGGFLFGILYESSVYPELVEGLSGENDEQKDTKLLRVSNEDFKKGFSGFCLEYLIV